MRLALFATDIVGLRVAAHLGAMGEELACLVVDAHDRKGFNEQIVAAAGISPDRVVKTSPETRDLLPANLARFAPDLGLLAWWPYILDAQALRTTKQGYLNFHPSLLPHGRGKAPNFWALVEGTPFGTTIHWVDVGIDSGDIAFQREIPVGWDDTGETLYRKALDATVELFVEAFPRIRTGDIPRIAQPATRCHYQRELEGASQIDLDRTYTGRELLDLLRARTFAPHPAAWFESEDGRYEVRVEIRQVGTRGSRKEAA